MSKASELAERLRDGDDLSSRIEAATLILEQEKRIGELEAEKGAIITLLYTDEVFVGSHWEQFPDAEKGVWPVLCAFFDNYGADSQQIPPDEIIPLANAVKEFGRDAVQAWVCCQREVEDKAKGALSKSGKAALDHFRRARTTLKGE